MNVTPSRFGLLLALAASSVPLLLLLPLGGLWLWEQGWLLAWLAFGLILGAAGYGLAWWLGRRVEGTARQTAESVGPVSGPNPDFSPLDEAAWASVTALAAEVDPEIILDQGRLWETARETIDRVARHYHPGVRHPVWRFTLPEALLLSERVSVRLRRVLLAHVPGAHMLSVGQAMRIWDLKPVAQRGARVFRGVNLAWRMVRLVNPASALLAEARGHLVSAALGDAGAWIKQAGARIWVEEVGRGAIELYSGRLALDARAAERDAAAGEVAPAQLPGPIRLLVAGQANAGKSSLINALCDSALAEVDVLPRTAAFTAFELRRDGELEATLIDSPGLSSADDIGALTDLAWNSDGLLWVTAAHRADRALERVALDAIRARFAAEPRRRMPPVRVVVSHIDRLSPVREWDPPYDLDDPGSGKAASIRSALDAIATDLGVALEATVPVALPETRQPYNLDLLWLLLADDLDAARRSRILRLVAAADPGRWRQLLAQAVSAGRTLMAHARS